MALGAAMGVNAGIADLPPGLAGISGLSGVGNGEMNLMVGNVACAVSESSGAECCGAYGVGG